MKKKIHPKYHPEATVKCACGNTFTVGSTVEKIDTEICSACHPFYTGKEKLIDTAGRVDRFKKIKELKEKASKTRKGKAVKKKRAAQRKLEKEKEKIKKEIKEADAKAKK